MTNALKCFGISHNVLQVICSSYDYPSFTIRGMRGMEALGEVQSGIRLGCPLSPYFFIIVLWTIFLRCGQRHVRAGDPRQYVVQLVFELEYAVDTLRLSLTTPQLQSILGIPETEASRYGMSLNQGVIPFQGCERRCLAAGRLP